jgi:hypothetical protein
MEWRFGVISSNRSAIRDHLGDYRLRVLSVLKRGFLGFRWENFPTTITTVAHGANLSNCLEMNLM